MLVNSSYSALYVFLVVVFFVLGFFCFFLVWFGFFFFSGRFVGLNL